MPTKRTAADDLRALGFPAETKPESDRQAVEEVEDVADETNLDLKAEESEETDAKEDEQKKASRSNPDETDELEEEEESEKGDQDWKKRFVGSQKQHLEDKRQIDEQNARIARLEQQATSSRTVEPATARDETATRLAAELDQVDPTDKDARKKVIQKWVGTIEQTSEEVARRVVGENESQKAGHQQAVTLMKASLKKKGLDPEKYFPMADAKAAHLKATNRQWFTDVPVSQQFDALADLVAADRASILAEQTKEANVALRKDAEGVVGKGNKTVTKPKSTDKEEVPDRSFTQQQCDVQQLRLKEGNRRYAEAGR